MPPMMVGNVFIDDVRTDVEFSLGASMSSSEFNRLMAFKPRIGFKRSALQTHDGQIQIKTITQFNSEDFGSYVNPMIGDLYLYSVWERTTPVNRVDYRGATLIDLTQDTISPDVLLEGITAHDNSGRIVTGSMLNIGSIAEVIDGMDTKSVTIPAGYTTGGTIAVDGSIDIVAGEQADLILQVSAELEGKAIADAAGICNVRISTGAQIDAVFYTTVVNEVPIEQAAYHLVSESTVQCMCGTRVIIMSDQANLNSLNISGCIVMYAENGCIAVQLTVQQGETAVISCEEMSPS